MKSKLAIAVTLWGWFLFVAWLAYAVFRDRMTVRISQSFYNIELQVFYVLIILIPLVYTFLGYLVNEREKLLKRVTESEEKYRALAFSDELTSLNNRRGFFFLAEQQLTIANRAKKKILLIFVDVDNLKWINDNLGHKEGDQALIDTANILKNTFRKSDIIARIGGDEFTVFSFEASKINTDVLAIRLRVNLETYNEKVASRYKLSLSIGFSDYDPESPSSIEQLLARADANMHEPKRKTY